MNRTRPSKIISGGQTGADRAGLDVAIHLGIPWGGWAPRGWICENTGVGGLVVTGRGGTIHEGYRADRQTARHGNGLVAPEGTGKGVRYGQIYRERTELNVEAGDATLLFYWDEKTPGTRLTHKLCGEMGKVCQPVEICSSEGWGRIVEDIQLVKYFIAEHVTGKVLNIAGSRESKAPGIYAYVYTILREALR